MLARRLEIVHNPCPAGEYEAARRPPPKTSTSCSASPIQLLRGQVAACRALLQKILDGKLQAKDSDVASARRFAVILATRGNYPDLQKAQAMIEKKLGRPGSFRRGSHIEGQADGG